MPGVDGQVGPAKVMKAVGAQVADRDNGVRSAALDVVRAVYENMLLHITPSVSHCCAGGH